MRLEVAAVLRRLYDRHLTTTSGGNVSARVGSDAFAITPGRLDKSVVKGEQVAVLGLDGSNHTPDIVPSSEWLMHATIYRLLPTVAAVVHAHPPVASLFACTDTPIDRALLCETYALLDPLVTVAYARSGSPALAQRVAEAACHSSCLLLQNHGVLATGASVVEAFTRLELIEEAARATWMSRFLDGVRRLTEGEMRDLDTYVGRRPAPGHE